MLLLLLNTISDYNGGKTVFSKNARNSKNFYQLKRSKGLIKLKLDYLKKLKKK
jgi:hypothetical protein